MRLKIAAMHLPAELSFLGTTQDIGPLKEFGLLKSKYEADTWLVEGISNPIKLNIILDDGSKLSDKKNLELQGQIKAWIAIQASGLIKFGGATKQRVTKRILIVIAILDYLLKSPFASLLRRHGLKIINEQIIRHLLHRITSKSTTAERFYFWPENLDNYIRSKLFTDPSPFSISESPLSPEQYHAAQQMILVESKLTLNEAVRRPAKAFNPILNSLYENTIYGHRRFIFPEGLIFKKESTTSDSDSFTRAPVRSKHEKIIKQNFSTYISCIESLQHLEVFGYDTLEHETMEYLANLSSKPFNLPDADKYRSLPIDVGLKALRCSIEFVLRYGIHILNAYAEVLEYSNACGAELLSYVKNKGIINHLPSELNGLRITTWSKLVKQTDFPDRFGDLGLHDYMAIFYGAAQIIIGTLSARRQEELIKSSPNDFDKRSRSIGFYIGKSGIGDSREYTHRPIPNICLVLSDMIGNFQERMINIGAKPSGLFSRPLYNRLGFKGSHHTSFNDSLDRACAYFELRCDITKQCFHIRQHQLRRLFAQAFYWSAFGDLDILRWFLAHTDKAHVYRYITERIPGAVLNTIKAEFTAEFLRRGNKTHSELEEVITERFGTSSFSLLDRDEFETYLTQMFETGQVVMEPDFLEHNDGKQIKFKYEIEHV